MLRLILVAAVAAALIGTAFAPSASAATLCVGPAPAASRRSSRQWPPHTTATRSRSRAGTFAGGITIDKSIRVQGAGADRTIIRGGGPVVTIFRSTAPDALNVSIDGVTITGGVNNTQPGTEVTFGGGIWIPTSQLDQPPFNGTGATVIDLEQRHHGQHRDVELVHPARLLRPTSVRVQHRRRNRQRRRPDAHQHPRHEQHRGLDPVSRIGRERRRAPAASTTASPARSCCATASSAATTPSPTARSRTAPSPEGSAAQAHWTSRTASSAATPSSTPARWTSAIRRRWRAESASTSAAASRMRRRRSAHARHRQPRHDRQHEPGLDAGRVRRRHRRLRAATARPRVAERQHRRGHRRGFRRRATAAGWRSTRP